MRLKFWISFCVYDLEEAIEDARVIKIFLTFFEKIYTK